jgi:hypothetical protein
MNIKINRIGGCGLNSCKVDRNQRHVLVNEEVNFRVP